MAALIWTAVSYTTTRDTTRVGRLPLAAQAEPKSAQQRIVRRIEAVLQAFRHAGHVVPRPGASSVAPSEVAPGARGGRPAGRSA